MCRVRVGCIRSPGPHECRCFHVETDIRHHRGGISISSYSPLALGTCAPQPDSITHTHVLSATRTYIGSYSVCSSRPTGLVPGWRPKLAVAETKPHLRRSSEAIACPPAHSATKTKLPPSPTQTPRHTPPPGRNKAKGKRTEPAVWAPGRSFLFFFVLFCFFVSQHRTLPAPVLRYGYGVAGAMYHTRVLPTDGRCE